MDIRHSAPETVRGDLSYTGVFARAIKECRRMEHRLRSGMGVPNAIGDVASVKREALRMAVGQRLLAGGIPVEDPCDGRSLHAWLDERRILICFGTDCSGCQADGAHMAVRAGLPGSAHVGASPGGCLSVDRVLMRACPRLCLQATGGLGRMDPGTANLMGEAGALAARIEPKPGRLHHNLLRLIRTGSLDGASSLCESLMGFMEAHRKDQEPVRTGFGPVAKGPRHHACGSGRERHNHQ